MKIVSDKRITSRTAVGTYTLRFETVFLIFSNRCVVGAVINFSDDMLKSDMI